MSIVEILTDAGVVDTGQALVVAAARGGEAAVKFLLQQREASPAGLDVSTSAIVTGARHCSGALTLAPTTGARPS